VISSAPRPGTPGAAATGPVLLADPAADPPSDPSPGPAVPAADRLWSTDFRLYFTARSVAMLGDTMLPVALSAGLIQYGYSARDIGLVMAAYTACFAGLVVSGGVFADRSRHVLQAGSVAALLVCALLLSVPAIRNLRRAPTA
jgi:hypothetical protein